MAGPTAGPTQFSLLEAIALAEDGIRRAELGSAEWLLQARRVARELAATRGSVTGDDVRRALENLGLYPAAGHYKAMGGAFHGLRWRGDWRRSEVVEGHGNLQRVWVLPEGGAYE